MTAFARGLGWLAVLAVFAMLAWGGRAAPQIMEYVSGQVWFTKTASADSFRYGGVDWQIAPAIAVRAGDDLPPGQTGLALRMTIRADAPVYQLQGCRVAVIDSAGRIWPEAPVSAATRVLARLMPDGAAGACDGAAYGLPPDQAELVADTLFLMPSDAQGPFTLLLSTRAGRPWQIKRTLRLAAPWQP